MAKPENVLKPQEILKRLFDLGYFGAQLWKEISNLAPQKLDEAVVQFQEFHGLKPDAFVGPITAAKLFRHRCGLPDFEMRSEDDSICKWPQSNVKYASTIRMPGITDTQAAAAYDEACAQWSAVCGIKMTRVEAKLANIAAQSGLGKANNLDNRGGTLAWSELPCGVTMQNQLSQMFDEAEAWTYNMAVAVICHEVGHALGLPHLGNGTLMAPYYNPGITKPQAGDIAEMVARYGNPTALPPPSPTPPQPTTPGTLDVSGVITINGVPYVLTPRGK